MEFMLSEAVPIYSGAWHVAGDQLKAAVIWAAVVGVGALPARLFSQEIDKDGANSSLPVQRSGQLPITPLRQANGEWLRLEIALPGYSSGCAPAGPVGRVKLYLLDSNDAANFPLIEGLPASCMAAGPNCG